MSLEDHHEHSPLVHNNRNRNLDSNSSSSTFSTSTISSWTNLLTRKSIGEYVLYYMTILKWIRHYSFRSFLGDLISGLTVGVMAVPQSIAYATLGGLDGGFGLTTSFFSGVLYFLFGSSPYSIIGPTTIMGILISGVSKELIPLILFFSGLFAFILSLLRLGYFFQLISHTVINGFTFAAGILIIGDQLKPFFGITGVASTQTIYSELYSFFANLSKINWWTVLIGITSLVICILATILSRRVSKHFKLIPMALIVCIAWTLLSWQLEFKKNHEVDIIGSISQGIHAPFIPDFKLLATDYLQVLTSSSLIAFVSFLDCYSIGKTLAVRTNSILEPDKELFALGVIGLVTSFFQCMPVTASFSRSSVNVENAKSQVSGLIGGLVVLMTMYFLTPLLFYLPKAVLSAIIIASVIPLLNPEELVFHFKSNKEDFFLSLITIVFILIFGIEAGLAIGLVFAVLSPLRQVLKPRLSVLMLSSSNLEQNQMVWKPLENVKVSNLNKQLSENADPNDFNLKTENINSISLNGRIIVCRLEESLLSMNSEYVRLKLSDLLSKFDKKKEPNPFQSTTSEKSSQDNVEELSNYLILDLSLSNQSDILAVESLIRYSKQLEKNQNSKIIVCALNEKLKQDFRSVNFLLNHEETKEFSDVKSTLEWIRMIELKN